MFGSNFHIGTAIGIIFMSFIPVICSIILSEVEYSEGSQGIIVAVLFLIAFLISGIGLILRRTWALIFANATTVTVTLVLIFLLFFLNESEQTIESYLIIFFIVLFSTGSLLVLNNNTIKRAFNQEIVHNDLDDILDA